MFVWFKNFYFRWNVIINNFYTSRCFVSKIIHIIVSNCITDISFIILDNLFLIIHCISYFCTRISHIRNFVITNLLTCQIICFICYYNFFTIDILDIRNCLYCIYWFTSTQVNNLFDSNFCSIILDYFNQFALISTNRLYCSFGFVNQIIVFFEFNVLCWDSIKFDIDFKIMFCIVNSIFYSNSYWIFFLVYIDFIVFLFFNSYIVNVSICGFSICQCYYRWNIIEQNNYTITFCFLCVTDLYSSIFMYCNVNFTIFTVVFFTYIVFNFMVGVICL